MALEFGMSYEEFWFGDPNLFVSYRNYFKNTKKREFEEWNYKSWLQGLYIHNGNIIVENRLSFSINRMLGGKGQQPKETYPTKPYDLNKQNKGKDLKEENRKKYFNSFNYFASMKENFIKKIKKGE